MGYSLRLFVGILSPALFGCIGLYLCEDCTAIEEPKVPLLMSLEKMSITAIGGSERCEVFADLLFTNRSSEALCLLPSEYRFDYFIRYPNGKSFGGDGARSTGSTSARDLSDLNLDTVVISPGKTEKVRVTIDDLEWPRDLRAARGRIELDFQCRPNYEGRSYRGVRLFLDPLKLTSNVNVVNEGGGRKWIIKCVESRESDTNDKGTEKKKKA